MNNNYYKILNLTIAKQKGSITDELVRKNYLQLKEQYIKLSEKTAINKVKKAKSSSIKALTEIFSLDYKQILEDAYNALATENGRKHYDELLMEIEEHLKKTQETNKTKTNSSNKEETEIAKMEEKQDFGKKFKEAIKNTNQSVNTKQILEKIKQEAEKKYSIDKEIGDK